MDKIKNINNKTKLIFTLMILIIIIGIAITATIGLNFDLKYQSAQKIELYIKKDFEISDMQKIVNEVMPKTQTIIQKVEVYEDTVSITAKEITDEQKQEIITKINEKYELDLSADNIEITSVQNLQGRDIVKKYIMPIIIATIIILIYMVIRYNKLGKMATILKTIAVLALVELMFLSVLAITRIPISYYTLPLGIILAVLTLTIITYKNEKKLVEYNRKKNKNSEDDND